MITKILCMAAAGAVGTLARAGLSALLQRAAGPGFPWGTAGVNLLGCFLFGLVWAMTEHGFRSAADVRLVVLTGFMGAFTTFSTFVFECGELGQTGRYAACIANMALQNAFGLACLFVGMALGRALGPA